MSYLTWGKGRSYLEAEKLRQAPSLTPGMPVNAMYQDGAVVWCRPGFMLGLASGREAWTTKLPLRPGERGRGTLY